MQINDYLKDKGYTLQRERFVAQLSVTNTFDENADELNEKALEDLQKDVLNDMMRLFN